MEGLERPSPFCGDDQKDLRVLEKHRPALFVWVRRHFHLRADEAEDVVQWTIEKAHRSRHRFNPRWAVSTWLYTILKRTALNFVRRPKAAAEVEVLSLDGLPESLPDGAEPPDRQFERLRLKEKLLGMIARLPARQAEVIRLYFWEQLTFADISRQMALTERQVGHAYKLAIAALKEMLTG